MELKTEGTEAPFYQSLVAAVENNGDSTTVSDILKIAPKKDKEWALRSAAWSGNIHIVSSLLGDPDIDINSKGVLTGRSSLHHACHHGHVKIVDLLLNASADVNLQDNGGCSSLHIAASIGAVDIIDKLLNAGADITLRKWDGGTCLHAAAQHGRSEVVKKLLIHKADPNSLDNHGKLPIDRALGGKSLENVDKKTIQLLIDAGNNITHIEREHIERSRNLTQTGTKDPTYLSLVAAVQGGKCDEVSEILRNSSTKAKEWVLRSAAWDGRVEVLPFIIAHADVNINSVGNLSSRSSLHHAVYRGHEKVVQLLLQASADPNIEDNSGLNSLHIAAQSGNVRLTQMLQRAGADPNSQAVPGMTSLHHAVQKEHEKVVEILLQGSADPNRQDNVGLTSLNIAARNGNVKIVEMLLRAGADPNITMRSGVSCLHQAVEEEHEKVIKLLLQYSADPKLQDDSGRTSLYIASREGNARLADMLLRAGADPNVQTVGGLSCLHVASTKGSVEVVDLLLKAGADISVKKLDGGTSLHNAAKNGRSKVVEQLLQYGADPNIPDKTGKIPLQLALERNKGRGGEDQKVIEILINAGSDLNLLGKDEDSRRVRLGVRTQQQVDESRGKGVQDLSPKYVKSSDRFVKSPAAKMIVIGKYNAGKTSLIRTMEKKKTVIIPEDSNARTRGIEVSVHRLQKETDHLQLYAYDFGGQPSYFPIHQVYLSPHSLFLLVADFGMFSEDQRETMQFYHIVNHRVVRPVFITVGTKSDICPDDVDGKKKTLLKVISMIEAREVKALKTRARKIKKALQQLGNKEKSIMNFEFQGLPKERLDEKLALVNLRLMNRPHMADDIFTVSSHDYVGIEELEEEISKIIVDNPDLFPSFSIPETWFAVENKIQDLRGTKSWLDLSEFKKICSEYEISQENEIGLLLDYLRIKGLLIHYGDYEDHQHKQLKNTVFIDPHYVTNVLSLIFDHENYGKEFWDDILNVKHLPTDQYEEARALVNRGIISEALLECMLEGTKLEGDVDLVLNLMKEFDLFLELEPSNTNVKLRSDMRYFLLPSLLQSNALPDLTHIWPASSPSTECILQLYLFTPVEPYGLFDKATVRLNYLFDNRYDMKGCTVGDIHKYKDKLKMKICMNDDGSSYSIFSTVRTDITRMNDVCNTMKFLAAVLMELMKFCPSVLWDWYIVCPRCKLSTPASRWPAENTLFHTSGDFNSPPVRCELCKEEMDTIGGFPIVKESQKGFHTADKNFSKLLALTVRMIHKDWRWLARHLYRCIDEADLVIEDVPRQHVLPSLSDCVCDMLCDWRQRHGGDACVDALLSGLLKISRLDILHKAGYGESVSLKTSEHENKLRSDPVQASRREVMLLIGQNIGPNEWRFLHRYLNSHITDMNYPDIPDIEYQFAESPERCYQMLRRWRHGYGTNATYDKLITALIRNNRKDIADKVKEICESHIVDIHNTI